MTEATGTTTITMNGTRKPRIYVAGPMRGITLYNFPAFDAARDRLNALGWDAVSPADIDRAAGFDAMTLPDDFDWDIVPESAGTLDEIMLRDIEALETTDAIFMLKCWEQSSGANRELAEARKLGLREFYEDVCASPDPSVMCSMADDAPLPPFDFGARATELMREHIDNVLNSACPDYDKPLLPKEQWTGHVTVPTETRYTDREGVLDEAKSLICGDRNTTYGPPSQDFQRTADMMNALFGWMLKDGNKFKSRDVAWIMMLVKASRSQHSPKRDNYVDAAGYAACGWECEVESKKREDIA